MRIMLLPLLFLFPSFLNKEKAAPFDTIQSEFPLLWKTEIGNACFRTNVAFNNDELYIGSNGDYFLDVSIAEPKSGVYAIDRRTGRQKKHFGNELLGDMDVNGVLLYKGRIYFGNDNEEFICASSDGKTIWLNAASADVEHEPVLITANGKDMIVYASELGEVRAVNPENGKKYWSYYTPDFEGYKEGDNRLLFKIGAYFSNPKSFFTAPQLVDLNSDGVKDLVYLSCDNKVYAINGVNGKLLWRYASDFGLSSFFRIAGQPYEPEISFFSLAYQPDDNGVNLSMLTLNRNGKIKQNQLIERDYRLIGLNALTTSGGDYVVPASDSLYVFRGNKLLSTFYHGVKFIRKNEFSPDEEELRNGYDPLIGNISFTFGKEKNCVLLLNQHDYSDFSTGFIEIISLNTGRVLKRLALPAGSEMPPQIKDINGDGYLDLLVGCYDGFLYCYNLKIKA